MEFGIVEKNVMFTDQSFFTKKSNRVTQLTTC